MAEVLCAQICCSNQPFHMMLVPSNTDADKIYRITVALPDDPREEWTCTCPGWTWRGHCKHTELVTPCRWEAVDGPEEQTEEQWLNHQCPRCFGETYDDMVLVK